MNELNEGKDLLDQVLYPIGPNIEFGKKMVPDIPSQVESKLIKKYKIPINEFMNSLCLMAFILAECWRGKAPTGKNLDNFIICLKKPVLYLCFPKLLQGFRKFNCFTLPVLGMDSLMQSINICLSSSRKNFNVAIPLELINLSSTYFTYKMVPKEPHNRLRSPSDIFSLGQ
jgi:hypothetical protein